MEDLFPTRNDGICSCGCGRKPTGRKKKWFSKDCSRKALLTFYIVKGDNKAIREILFSRDQGYCRSCGVYDDNWHADHIFPVHKGGGACGIDNFQTLCTDCHKEKTILDRVPDSHDILTSRLNILPSSFDAIRTLNDGVREHIIGNTIRVS